MYIYIYIFWFWHLCVNLPVDDGNLQCHGTQTLDEKSVELVYVRVEPFPRIIKRKRTKVYM